MSQCFEAGSTGVNSAYACFAAGKLSYTGSTVSNTYTFSDANTLVIGAGTDAFSNAIKGTYTKTTLPSTYTCPSGSF